MSYRCLGSQIPIIPLKIFLMALGTNPLKFFRMNSVGPQDEVGFEVGFAFCMISIKKP